jgi:protein phosphatase
MNYSTISQKGLKRLVNEDAFLVEQNPTHYLFAIADGVGGLGNCHYASEYATIELKKMFLRGVIDLETCFKQINTDLLSDNEIHNRIAATTLTAVLVSKNTFLCDIAHVGDSRVYIIDDTIWHTEDHSLVQDLVNLGVITQEEAFGHPENHRLTQAIGIKNHIDVSVTKKSIKKSTLLLCSDGVSDTVDDAQLARISRYKDPKTACEQLLKKALNTGSIDDITIIIAHFDEN